MNRPHSPTSNTITRNGTGAHEHAQRSPAALPAPAPDIVGRERERALLHGALEQMLAGHGRLVLIGGEAGVGKTTLAHDLAQAARERGALVLSGGCYDLSVTPPYGPWVDALRRYPTRDASDADTRPDLPTFLSDPQALAALGSQEGMFTATATFFRNIARSQPLLLLLDDLQWADQVSLDLLRQVARDVRDLPILLLATYRTDELTRRHPLFQLLPFLVREAQAERVLLHRLDDAAVTHLLRNRYHLHPADEERLVTALRGNAEGNPLFLHEVLRTLEDERLLRPPTTAADCWTVCDLTHVPLPVLIQQVIELRLSHLDDAARELLDSAAVLGHSVPLHEWQAVSNATDSALAHAMQAGLDAHLLRPRPARSSAHAPADDGVEFTHALIREVLHNSIILPRRRALHRRVAEVLQQQPEATPANASAPEPDPDPDRIAHHYQQAGDRAAVPWLVAAAERALRLYAWSAAVQRFDTAVTLLERDGSASAAQRGWLLYRAGRLQRHSDPQRALDHLDAAERLADAVGDPVLTAFARFDRTLPMMHLDGTPLAVELAAAALPALQAITNDLARQHGVEPGWLADALAPRPVPCPSRGWADTAGDVATAAYAREATHACGLANAGRYREALQTADRILAHPMVADGRADIYAIADAHSARAIALAALGHPDAARSAFEREAELVTDAGHLLQVAESAARQLHHVTLPYDTDNLPERERLSSTVEQMYRRTVDSAPSGLPPRIAWVPNLILTGAWDEVQQLLSGVQGRVPLVVAGDGAVIARHQGRTADAWTLVRRAMPSGPVLNADTLHYDRLRHLAADLALDAGDLPTALAWIDVHAQALATGGVCTSHAAPAASVHLLHARYHALCGDLPQALNHAHRALHRATTPRQPLTLLHAHRLLGELHTTTATNDHPAAATHLNHALALADACHAPFERALVHVAQAALLLNQHTPATPNARAASDARAALDAAAEVATRLNARPTLTRIATLRQQADQLNLHATTSATRQAGHPTTQQTATTAPRLTARETDVLRLVADGLTDSDVAARLFISPRTVSTHLTSIYTKLNVSSRTAATRIALDERLL